MEDLSVDMTFVTASESSFLKDLENVTSGQTIMLSEAKHYSTLLEFLLMGVGISFMSIFGFISGILILMVVLRPNMRTSMGCLVFCLTLSDTIFVVALFFMFGLRELVFDYFMGKNYADGFFLPITPYLVFTTDVAQATTYYMKVAISLDRFIAICFPFHARSFCTWNNAKKLGSAIALGATSSYLIAHLSAFFIAQEFDADEFTAGRFELFKNCGISQNDSGAGLGSLSEAIIDHYYESRFFQWPYLTFVIFIPFLSLLFFNSALYLQMHRIRKRQQSMTSMTSAISSQSITGARVCISIAIVFFLRHLCFVFMAIIYGTATCLWYRWKEVLKTIDIFLFGANPTANFIVYVIMGTSFRRELIQVLKGMKLWPLPKSEEPPKGKAVRSRGNSNFELTSSITKSISTNSMSSVA